MVKTSMGRPVKQVQEVSRRDLHENRTTVLRQRRRRCISPAPGDASEEIQGAVALVKLDKVRGAQILPLRKTLKDDVLFVNIKDRVAKKALQGA